MVKISIIAGGALLLVCLIAFLIIKKKKNVGKETLYEADRKKKEAELKHSLENPEMLEGSGDAYRPLKVTYSTEVERSNPDAHFFSVQEINGNVRKKYVFSSEQPVFIGMQYGVAVIDNGKADINYICQIFYRKTFCVRSVGRGNLLVQRGRDSAYVDRKGIELKDKDVIVAGESEFHIAFI